MKRLKVLSSYAIISEDGLYRYQLGRVMDWPGQTALWIGINPSTADAEVDDQSIRKLYGFAEKLNIREWMVGNLFAYRTTNVEDLRWSTIHPIGNLCDHYLREMIEKADLVVVGWGRIDKVPVDLRFRVDDVCRMIIAEGKMPMCWGTCQDGSPRHPLMIPYSTRLERWL